MEFSSLDVEDLLDGRAGASALRSATHDADQCGIGTRVKSYLDYGAFTPIQAAAVAALNGPQDIVEQNRQLYKRRRDVMVDSFGRAGWDIPTPEASMFCWAPIPPSLAHLGSMEFSKQLLTHAQVAVAPGVGFGEDGEGYIRLALVENEHRIRQAARNVKRYLQSMGVNTPAAPARAAL